MEESNPLERERTFGCPVALHSSFLLSFLSLSSSYLQKRCARRCCARCGDSASGIFSRVGLKMHRRGSVDLSSYTDEEGDKLTEKSPDINREIHSKIHSQKSANINREIHSKIFSQKSIVASQKSILNLPDLFQKSTHRNPLTLTEKST